MTQQIPGLVSYVTVEGSHSLTMPRSPLFNEVLSAVFEFREQIRNRWQLSFIL